MLKNARAERAGKEAAETADTAAPTEEKPEETPAEPEEGADAEKPETEEGTGEEPEGEPEPEKPKDSVARGLAKIAAREREIQQKAAQVQRARAEVEQLRQSVDKELSAAREFAKRAKSDPVGALMAAIGDVAPEDLDYYARQFHLRSKGATSAEHRAQAERERRERESHAGATEAQTKIAELQKQLEDLKTEGQLEEQRREFIATVESHATEDETPLLAKALKSNAKQTRKELREVGGYLANRDGVPWPDAAEVAKAWETWKRKRIAAEFGEDAVDRFVTKPGKPTSPKPSPVADTTRRPVNQKTITADHQSATAPRAKPLTWDEEKEAVLREIKAGRVQ